MISEIFFFIFLSNPGPHFAAVNNNNEIIVTDFHNHSVKASKLPEQSVCYRNTDVSNVIYKVFSTRIIHIKRLLSHSSVEGGKFVMWTRIL